MKRNSSKVQSVIRFRISVLLFLFLFISAAGAGQSLIRVNATVDSSVITIGDRITYTLTIEHAENLQIQQPGPGANLGQFEIKDYRIDNPVKKDGMISQNFEYEISVFDTGTYVIPPFPVAFSESDSSAGYQIIKTEPIEIFVKSVLNAENAEIKDIKPPVSVPFNYRRWMMWGAAGLLILAAVLLTVYILRKRKKGEPLFRREVIRPAHEIALEELAELKSRWKSMQEKGEYKALYTRISDILRRYIENRYFVNALEETTGEIRQSLAEIEIDETVLQTAAGILQFADLVKFARYVPQEAETAAKIAELEAFIDKTRLVFEAVENKTEIPEESTAETAETAR